MKKEEERASEWASERGESNEHIDLMRLIVMQLISCTGASHRNERLAAERNKLGLAAVSSSFSFFFYFFSPSPCLCPVRVWTRIRGALADEASVRFFCLCLSTCQPSSPRQLPHCYHHCYRAKAFWAIWESRTAVIKGNRTGKHHWSCLLTQK